jgi:hypothetical protein
MIKIFLKKDWEKNKMEKTNLIDVVKCLFGFHSGKWIKTGIAVNGFGETMHERVCLKCGKKQYKIF